MKRDFWPSVFTALVILVLGMAFLPGCNKHDSLSSNDEVGIESQLSSFVNTDPYALDTNAVRFGDCDPMNMPLFARHGGGMDDRGGMMNGGRMGGPHGGFAKPNHAITRLDHLRGIVHCLELSAEQDTALRSVLKTLRSEVHAIIKQTRDEQKPLRDAAREKAKAVIDQLRNKEITRAEARTQLEQIRTDLLAELKPGRDAAAAAIKALEDAALTDIRALLDADQQAKWDEWIATGKVPC